MQHLDRRLSVYEFAALRLGKAGGNMGRHRFALLPQPIFAVKLCPDDLERLIQHFAGVMINPGSDRQVDHLLVFRFQFDGHNHVSPGCAVASHPTRLPFSGQFRFYNIISSPAPSDPEGFKGRPHALKVLVTCDRGYLPGLGEGGGEAICVGKIMSGLEAGGQLAEFHVNADNLNGKLLGH